MSALGSLLGDLPNELQDMDFRGLGPELSAFIYHRSTSASALNALWVQCAAREGDEGELWTVEEVRAHTIQKYSKAQQLLKAIDRFPGLAGAVHQLTLLLPYATLDDYCGGKMRPNCFSAHNTNELLSRLPQLNEARFIALPPAWRRSLKNYMVEVTGDARIVLPPHIKQLYLEEAADMPKRRYAMQSFAQYKSLEQLH